MRMRRKIGSRAWFAFSVLLLFEYAIVTKQFFATLHMAPPL